jgi:hypothetical protein
MKRDTFAGILLIAGSLVGMLVMMLHPTARDLMSQENFARLATLNAGVHGAALASLPILFLGLLGLARRLGPSDLTTAALVVYGLGAVAIVSAAVASGFVATPMFQRMLSAGAGSRDVYSALLYYTGVVNQGFAKVNVVASSVAILLWSAAILRSRRMARSAGIVGVFIGACVLLAFWAGHLRLDVHGFGIVTFAQSGWLIWVGVLLCRNERERIDQPGMASRA